ncbi:MAG TPA: MmcQ/YjbR family DNA-binding protein [Gammaproteobacteria bacterium]|nr:MmcQ/YjbR family DNA-binding protein [Gammaproteobacteria bacterium]
MLRRKRTPRTTPAKNAAALRKFALGFPEAYEEFPWGERVIKVRKKIFLILGRDAAVLRLSLKLPSSYGAALLAPFARPTAYNLGKSGWITASFEPGDPVPMDILRSWIDESYRAIAPKKLAATLPAG